MIKIDFSISYIKAPLLKKDLLFETIYINNAKAYNLYWHNLRLNRARKELFGAKDNLNIEEFLGEMPTNGIFRAKVIYNKDIINISYYPYTPKTIDSIKIVESNIDYSYKFLDRTFFNELFNKFRGYSEFLIIKDNLLKDFSIGNIALLMDNRWLTPKSPLLNGTTRERLIKSKKIFEYNLTLKDLKKAKKIALLNAMVNFKVLN